MRTDYAAQSHHTSAWPTRFRRLLVAFAVGAALLPVAPGAGASGQSFTFLGGGYGHSVGMSQFGAYGMALEGHTWQEIVTHYYTDTRVANLHDDLVDEHLFVNLYQERSDLTLTVRSTGTGSEEATVVFAQDGASLAAQVGDQVTITHLGAGRCRVAGPGGHLEGSCVVDADWDGF